MRDSSQDLKLSDGCGIAVVGGGPAGSFFSYFLLDMAQDLGLDVQLDLYEPPDFSQPGPAGCNMCGGIVSESLVQALAAEGITLGPDVIQRRIDSYFLHMDAGDVGIMNPSEGEAHRFCASGWGHVGSRRRNAVGLTVTFSSLPPNGEQPASASAWMRSCSASAKGTLAPGLVIKS